MYSLVGGIRYLQWVWIMARETSRSKKGSVSVLSQKGLLRLRWRLTGSDKRKLMYLGLPDTPSNRKKAELLAKQIEIDLSEDNYDPTLEKYKAQIRPSDINEKIRAQGESIVELFENDSLRLRLRMLIRGRLRSIKHWQRGSSSFSKTSELTLLGLKKPRSLWITCDSIKSLALSAIAWRLCQSAGSGVSRI